MRRLAALGAAAAALALAGYVGATRDGLELRPGSGTEPTVRREASPATTTGATGPEPPWTVEPPQEPVTVRAGVAIGLNARSPAAVSDYRIIDSGDSSVILHEEAHGSSVRRFEIVRAGAGNTVEWGKHGVYVKVRDAVLEDIRVSASEHAADCVTLRMAGTVVRRFVCDGAPPHVATYYQESDLGSGAYTSGIVELRHGRGTFRGNAAFWVALNGAATVRQAFVFHDIHVVGPEEAAFLRVLEPAFVGSSVTISGCSTLNGRAVSAADVAVPASTPVAISCP
jgi:hypothetical protein